MTTLAAAAPPEIQTILQATGLGWCHADDDTAGLAQRMEDAMDARADKRRLVEPNQDALRALTVQSTSAELARLFESVVSTR